jgi:hypothetical protein
MAELWWRGRLSGLPAAIAFALAVNLWLVTRYLYPQWMASGLVTMGFWIGLIVWCFAVVRSIREVPLLIAPRRVSEKPDRFPEARAAYLSGNWAEAEGLLTDVLAIEPRDPPALLLLTGVYRHSGRLEAAEILLREIVRLEVSEGWRLETEAEARRLDRAIEASLKKHEHEQAPAGSGNAGAADLTPSQKAA